MAEVAPPEAPKKVPWDKILAGVVVILIVVAAVGWLRPITAPADDEPPVVINVAPTAVGAVDTTVGEVGDAFLFTGAGSSDPDVGDSIAMWEWNFGDGSVVRELKAEGGDGNVRYVYSVPGEYVVGLTVTDTRNESANNDVSLITVRTIHPTVPSGNGTSPLAILGADKSVIQTAVTVNFDASSSWFWVYDAGSSPATFSRVFTDLIYSWSFGDGTTGTEAITTHSFAAPGNYAVKLVVTTPDGRKDVVIKTIRVLEPASPFTGIIKNPDAYVTATIGEPQTLDPALDYETAGGGVILQVLEPLIWYNKGFVDEIIPWLATEVPTEANGGISPDGLSYKFLIRQNVPFHTGGFLSAEDVEYTIERNVLRDPAGGPMYLLKEALFGPAAATDFIPYAVIDAAITRNDVDQSVTINLVAPFSPFLQVMAFWVGAILPKDFAIANGDWDGTAASAEALFGEAHSEFWDDNLAGTGPYKLVRWDRRQQIILERFDDYWGGNFPGEAKRAANIQTYIIKVVEEFSTRKLLLLSGDVDQAFIPIEFEDQVVGQPDLRIFRGLRGLVASPFFALNQNINVSVAGPWVGNLATLYPETLTAEWLTFFGDKNVRLAFSYAFDVQSFIDDILKGNAQQLASPIPEGLVGFNPTSPTPRAFDMAQAEASLKLAYAGEVGGSVWDRGFEFDLLYNTGNTARQAMATILKTNIESLNAARTGLEPFKLNVRGVEWGSVYIPALFTNGLTGFALGWIADYADPHNFMFPFLHSDGFFSFYLGYSNAVIDAKIQLAIEATDDATRAQLYGEIAQIGFDDAVYAFIIQGFGFRVERTWVRGWYFHPMAAGAYVWALDKF